MINVVRVANSTIMFMWSGDVVVRCGPQCCVNRKRDPRCGDLLRGLQPRIMELCYNTQHCAWDLGPVGLVEKIHSLDLFCGFHVPVWSGPESVLALR